MTLGVLTLRMWTNSERKKTGHTHRIPFTNLPQTGLTWLILTQKLPQKVSEWVSELYSSWISHQQLESAYEYASDCINLTNLLFWRISLKSLLKKKRRIKWTMQIDNKERNKLFQVLYEHWVRNGLSRAVRMLGQLVNIMMKCRNCTSNAQMLTLLKSCTQKYNKNKNK